MDRASKTSRIKKEHIDICVMSIPKEEMRGKKQLAKYLNEYQYFPKFEGKH